ncbi:restriction endonuclease subunit S [Schinkia azotoformans]|uniref:restriction endonuclease subunit S n=1 Tax=Schinkia azotoformans TaxID=1454 RepID=UPI001E559282|nr:restriction endonuclease subunit S [Schinkia azotoformans]
MRLGDVVREYKETCKGSKDGFPIVGLEHLIPEEINLKMWDEEKENTFTKMFRKGQVLFGRRRAYLKKAAVAPFDGICSGDITVIEAIHDKILPELLPFIIQNDSLFNFAVGNSAGSLSPRVKWENLKNYEFNLPDLAEQKRLAELLWAANDAKEAYKRLLTLTDDLVKSQFIEMFGLPIDNVKCFKKGTIREVVSEVKYGTSKPATIGGKYPYLRMNNITYEGQLDLTDLKFIDIPDKEIEKCVVRKGDVLFNRTNSKELVGKTCVFNIDTPMVIAGYIIRVKVNEKVIPEYLSTFLNLKYSKNILFEMCKAAIGQANINAQELQDIEIIIPPMSLQLKFLDLLHQTDKSKLSEHVTYNSLGDMLVNLNLFRR